MNEASPSQGLRAAREKTLPLLAPARRAAAGELAAFYGAEFDSWFVARTGYTGEDGFEVILPAADAERTWNALRAQGVRPRAWVREIPCGWRPA